MAHGEEGGGPPVVAGLEKVDEALGPQLVVVLEVGDKGLDKVLSRSLLHARNHTIRSSRAPSSCICLGACSGWVGGTACLGPVL